MAHKVVALSCNYARDKLVITAVGASPRGTSVLLRKVVVDDYGKSSPGRKAKVLAAVNEILAPIAD